MLSSDARAPLDGVSDRERYLQSLELIRGLEFDPLIRSLATAGQPYHEHVDSDEARRRIEAISSACVEAKMAESPQSLRARERAT